MTSGWAALNTIREAIHDRGMNAWEEERPVDPKHAAALALVEAALDAAEKHLAHTRGYCEDRGADGDATCRSFRDLAAALRAVREGK